MCKFIQQNLSQVQQDLTYLGKPPKENDKKLRTMRELSKKSRTPSSYLKSISTTLWIQKSNHPKYVRFITLIKNII